MICPRCQVKSKTVFSVPLGRMYRYRIYWCNDCRWSTETLEIPQHWRLKHRVFRIMFAIGSRKAMSIRRWLSQRDA